MSNAHPSNGGGNLSMVAARDEIVAPGETRAFIGADGMSAAISYERVSFPTMTDLSAATKHEAALAQ